MQPPHHHHQARLIPCGDLHEDPSSQALLVGCDATTVLSYPLVAEVSVVAPGHPLQTQQGWTVGTTDVVATTAADSLLSAGWVDNRVLVRWDRIPSDDVEVRHSSSVLSADQHRLGQLDGLRCQPDGRITHLVLRHGRLLGRRDVLVDIDDVHSIDNDAIVLSLTKEQAGSLEAQPLDQWLEATP